MLIEKIKDKKARIGAIGLGYVGLPLAVEMARAGFKTVGFDISPEKTESINQGRSYIEDIPENKLAPLIRKGRIRATTDFSELGMVDLISICVPTPLRKTKDPDISYILAAVDQIKRNLRKGQVIVLESTTYPGTTRELVLPAFTGKGAEVGKDFFLCFSPERIDPGNEEYKIKNTPKVIGGVTEICGNLGTLLYEQITDNVVSVSSPESAEMVKLLENTFRSVNIGLVNEVAIMCEKLGVDVWEVIDAAATKPFGFMKFLSLIHI